MSSLTKNKYFSPEERAHLEGVLERNKDTDFRNTTLIWTLLHTGARRAEVQVIRKKDITRDGDFCTLFLSGLKGGRDRDIPVPAWLFDRLRILSSELCDDDRIFNLGISTISQIWNLYRPCKKGTHAARHTRAMDLYAKTKDIRLVQRWLGHRYLDTTMIYADYSYSLEEMRKAMGV